MARVWPCIGAGVRPLPRSRHPRRVHPPRMAGVVASPRIVGQPRPRRPGRRSRDRRSTGPVGGALGAGASVATGQVRRVAAYAAPTGTSPGRRAWCQRSTAMVGAPSARVRRDRKCPSRRRVRGDPAGAAGAGVPGKRRAGRGGGPGMGHRPRPVARRVPGQRESCPAGRHVRAGGHVARRISPAARAVRSGRRAWWSSRPGAGAPARPRPAAPCR